MVGFSFAKSGGRAMTSESLLISLGFALSFALTPISRRLALRIGAIDNPGLRRIHSVATPRLGGPAILAALVLVMVLAAHWDPSINAFFWAHARRLGFLATGALMVTLVGAIDDVHAQRPATKLAVEVVAASIVVCGGYRIDPPMVPLGLLMVPLSIIFIVAVVNAVNLVDGLDGLAVGLCAIISMTLLLMGRINGAGGASLMAAALCGVLLGFLPYNVHPARIFLGDSGALLLGFMVAVGALATSHPTGSLGAAAAPLLALGLPLGELMLSTTRRVLREIAVLKPGGGTRYGWYLLRRPVLFAGDRDHIHHRLLTLGFGHREAVLLLYAVGAGFCLAALLVARGVAAPLPVIAAVGLAAGAGVRWLGYRELRPLRAGLLLPLAETFARGGPAFEVVLDAILITSSGAVALLLEGDGSHAQALIALPMLAMVQMLGFAMSGMYRTAPARRGRDSGIDDALRATKALAFAVGITAMAAMLAPALGLGARIVLVNANILSVMVLGTRLSYRILEHLHRGEEVEQASYATDAMSERPSELPEGDRAHLLGE